MDFLKDDWCELAWTTWIRFDAPRSEFKKLPRFSGVYRIKPMNEDFLMYIGQTGRTLIERLSELRRYRNSDMMPYNDPHTAAPSLWAWRDATGMDFECSASIVSNSDKNSKQLIRREREGLECYLLWQYRSEYSSSTLCNFGRFHPNYTKSRGKKSGERGGRLPEGKINPAGGSSHPPLYSRGEPQDQNWMALDWSEIQYLEKQSLKTVPNSPGVYRIMDIADNSLIYVGQSKNLKNRLHHHAMKKWDSQIIAFSYYEPHQKLLPHQLKEIENDLIGDYFSKFKNVPKYQFLNYSIRKM